MKRPGSSLMVVAGAPGSGKSTTAAWLSASRPASAHWLALDIDWLLPAASSLAQRDIRKDASCWPAYGALWFDVLGSIAQNSLVPVLFTPNSPADFDGFGIPDWCVEIHWIRLDCADAALAKRLRMREWSIDEIEAAVADQQVLRQQIPEAVLSDDRSVSQVGELLVDWFQTGHVTDRA